jgi:hypothetical protein
MPEEWCKKLGTLSECNFHFKGNLPLPGITIFIFHYHNGKPTHYYQIVLYQSLSILSATTGLA